MSTVDIFYSTRPKRGKYISDGKYGFGIVDGAPAMRCRWLGGFFPSEEVFHFQTQTEGFLFLDTKSIEGTAKWGTKGAPEYLGNLGALPFAAIAAAVTAWQAATTKNHRHASVCSLLPKPSGTFRFVSRSGPDRLC
jgi:hypothetical protein